MSTRSGKRIHASSDSPIVSADVSVQSERKTRSKKQKENVELPVFKKHYVSYPADDDTATVSSDATETHEKVRKTRRNTLKEHNVQVPALESLDSDHISNTVRKSRRGKKLIEEPENVEELVNIQNHAKAGLACEKKKNKKKKNHKKQSMEMADMQDITNHVTNKTTNKKKLRGLNFVINDQEQEHMNCDNSDSFHSAAGSPVNINNIENDCQIEIAVNIVGHQTEDSSHTIDIKLSDIPSTSKSTDIGKKKKRKMNKKGMNNDEETIDKQNTTCNKSSDVTTTSHTKPQMASKEKRNSNIKNSTSDKIVKDTSEERLNTTFDKSSDVTITPNTMSERPIKKKRKTSIKNSTFNKIETEAKEEKLNSTFDKSPDVSTPSNTLSKIATEKNRKSSIKDSTFDKIETEAKEEKLNTTFDKSPDITVTSKTMSERATKKKRKSSFKDSTFDKIENDTDGDGLKTSIGSKIATPTTANTTEDVSSRKRKRSSIKNHTVDYIYTNNLDEYNLNSTFNKTANRLSYSLDSSADVSTKKRRKSSIKNSTFENVETNGMDVNVRSPITTSGHPITISNSANGLLTEDGNKSNVLITFTADQDPVKLNDTPHKTSSRQSSVINTTYDKIEKDSECNEVKDVNGTFDKDDTDIQNSFLNPKSHSRKISLQNNEILNDSEQITSNGEIASEDNAKTENLDSTFNKNNNIQLNTTFDSEKKLEALVDLKKSSLISSDASTNVTFDKSEDNSRISITSDESKTENILNHTPVLIESSIDESLMSEDKSPVNTPDIAVTPLKREGTFTKETSDVVMSPKPKGSAEKTPVKRKSSPGCTPFPFSKSSQKENAKLNVTRSIEKSLRRSSVAEVAPRQTRVMFCSPANNPAVVSQLKGRVIKSNLKGSNKSFVFDDSVSSESRAVRRKRSLTLGAAGAGGEGAGAGAGAGAKRSRLADGLQLSVDRLSRPRTQSAAAKLSEPGTPSKPATPGKARPEGRVARTRLPNFAALHQKQFARMESLDECQRRRARRARHLLTPTGSVGLIERISPKETPPKSSATVAKEPGAKQQTPSKPRLPTLESLIPRYNRFGFKLHVDGNPFSVGRGEVRGARGDRGEARGDQGEARGDRGEARRDQGEVRRDQGEARRDQGEARRDQGETRRDKRARQTCLPSLAGTTSRREAARQAIMREKSFSEKRSAKRSETRTVIKGVRTNRRFELQMKMRNVDL